MDTNKAGDRFRSINLEIIALLAGAIVMFALGMVDDLKRVAVGTKLVVEVIVAVVLCSLGICIDHITIQDLTMIRLGGGGLVTVLWVVGITNAINLIDGLDGLAAGISAMACGIIALLSVCQGNVILATGYISMEAQVARHREPVRASG